MSSSIGEPETSSLRTENFPSISDKDYSELFEKIEKSVCRRIKDTEVGQREILKMVENLSSKIDSLSDKTPLTTNSKVVEPDLTEPGPSAQREDIYELPHSLGQHNCFSPIGVVMINIRKKIQKYQQRVSGINFIIFSPFQNKTFEKRTAFSYVFSILAVFRYHSLSFI